MSGLAEVFRANRLRILATYGLFNVESGLRLAIPSALGLAIDDLLAGAVAGLFVFIGVQLGFMLIGAMRQAYDTRVFTRIYGRMAGDLVIRQRREGVDVSRVAARSALTREMVDFFERDLPSAMTALYSVVGALVMLAFYDPWIVAAAMGLFIPVAFLNVIYGRITRRLNAGLNDQLEEEVGIVAGATPSATRAHYTKLARWWVKLSDWQVLNFGVTELFVMALTTVVLLRVTGQRDAQPGRILAVIQYVMMFVGGLDRVPTLVVQIGRLRDIAQRIRHDRVDTDDGGRRSGYSSPG